MSASKRTLKLLLVLLTLGVTCSPAVAAGTCDLRGKFWVMAWKVCGNPFLPGHECMEGRAKATLIGDKVLWYEGPESKQGLVYYLGQTKSVNGDPLQQQAEASRDDNANLQYFVSGSFDGVEMRLLKEGRGTLRGTNQLLARDRISTVIRFPDCTKCQLIDFSLVSENVYESRLSAHYVLRKQSCYFE